MIYLDNAATTRVYDTAADAAKRVMLDDYFNPNATYSSAVKTNDDVEQCRRDIAKSIGALPEELIFTSCATESNNAVFDCCIKNKKGNIVTTCGEHSSVYENAVRFKSRGIDVRFAPLKKSGSVDENSLLELIDENTALVSVIHVNNETGVVNPIARIAERIRKKSPRAIIHSDGVQALLKTEISLDALGVDLYSASAHKIGAPKGIGILYVKNGINISPILYGGGQERGLRSGTQNTPYIAAYAAAVERFIATADRSKMTGIRHDLSVYFESRGCFTVGTDENSGYIICVCIPGVKAEILQNAVHDKGVIIGKGAACSGTKRGNRVLSAMGLDPYQIECCIRLSFFTDTDSKDVLNAANIIIDTAQAIRSNNVG